MNRAKMVADLDYHNAKLARLNEFKEEELTDFEIEMGYTLELIKKITNDRIRELELFLNDFEKIPPNTVKLLFD